MASIIELTCPKCDRDMKAPASGIGKKIRCKGCNHQFVIEEPSRPKEKAVQKKPKKKVVAPKKKATAPPDEDDDSDGYGVQDIDLGKRCPECANEMESEEAVICLHCGYNTQTRTRYESKVLEEQTGQDKFMWLLPGILCCVGILLLIGYCFFHHYALPGICDEELGDFLKTTSMSRAQALNPFASEDEKTGGDKTPEGEFWWIVFHPMIELWIVIGALYISFKCGKFAYKRLILHPDPPEIEKEKKRKSS